AGIAINQTLDYPSKDFYGRAYGHYEAECWTPTLGVKAWRFTLTSRFGFKTRAKGKFYAGYSLPFFVNPETFDMKYDFEDEELFNDPEFRQDLMRNAADSVVYSTKDKNGNEPGMFWQMPTGLTLDYEIIPEILSVSYTKIFGDITLRIDQIAKEVKRVGTDNGTSDTLTIDMGVSVDHIMLVHLKLYRAFMNIGVFGMDFRYDDEDNLLGKNIPYVHLGSMAMLPVLDLGASIGGKLQLLIELNVLPLPAFKSGVSYYF
ncbi:MAG: hypothetical protein Q4F84_10550, partial [Fibrobacter sp.]|nr:hypothetical protein [Fibrobacter sp.]